MQYLKLTKEQRAWRNYRLRLWAAASIIQADHNCTRAKALKLAGESIKAPAEPGKRRKSRK